MLLWLCDTCSPGWNHQFFFCHKELQIHFHILEFKTSMLRLFLAITFPFSLKFSMPQKIDRRSNAWPFGFKFCASRTVQIIMQMWTAVDFQVPQLLTGWMFLDFFIYGLEYLPTYRYTKNQDYGLAFSHYLHMWCVLKAF